MPYDTRVIRFIKTTADNPIKYNTKADYICLGHFDMMHIDNLKCAEGEKDYPLERIRKDRLSGRESELQCPENFLNSLYVLKNVSPEDQIAVENFWSSRATFTVVTRVHCKYPAKLKPKKKKPFSEIIECYCCKLSLNATQNAQPTNDTCVIMLNGMINAETGAVAEVRCLVYDSLELGDTVVVMKGNSLAAILDIIRKVSEEPCVKDTYSYCGIHRVLIQNQEPISKWNYKKMAILEHVSTRFSVRNNRCAQEYFDRLEKLLPVKKDIWKKLAYVTGTADHVIHWGKCTEEEFLQIIHTLIQLSDQMHQSFNDVITRVGICQPKVNSSQGSCSQESETKLVWLQRLETTMQWLRAEIRSERAPSWKYTLLKLLGTLKTMSNNYVMDDLTQLIIPGVDSFLERINFLRAENNGQIPDNYYADISEFLDQWTSLSNDIAQLESQLTQHPELSPVRYYIPAMLLQFELRFAIKVCEALTDNEVRSFQPMLIPSGMENLNTICTLDPRQKMYDGKCPLLVFIPIRDLYRPWEITHRLTHEMAHYCEDSGRSRDLRYKMLFQCLAEQLVEHWYDTFLLDSNENISDQINAKNSKYAQQFADVLAEIAHTICSDQGKQYLSHTEIALNVAAGEVLRDNRYLQRYLQTVCPEYFYAYHNNWLVNMNIFQKESKQEAFISDHISKLTYLCAECYADIAMVLLLQCDFEDYYFCVYHYEYMCLKERRKSDVEPPLQESLFKDIQRMSLVISVISALTIRENAWNVDDIRLKFADKYPWVRYAINETELTEELWRSICTPGEIPNRLTPKEMKHMQDYLTHCAKMLKDKLEGRKYGKRHHVVQQLRKNINFVNAEQFDWNAIREFLCQDDPMDA